MKKIIRWAGLYLLAASTLFALLVVVDMARGTAFAEAWGSALLWSMLSSAIFIGARYYQAERNVACALCEQLPRK